MTVSARARWGLECFNCRPFLKKRRSLNRSMFVLRFSSGMFVRRYSQDRMAKKIAAVHNWAMAMFSLEDFIRWSCLITQSGSAFCCLTFLSLFLYPLNCCCRMNASFPSSSVRGSGRLLARKVCATLSTEALTVVSAREV